MPALQMMITNAGLNALVDAQNGVTTDIVIAQMGLTAQIFAMAPTITALPGEFKRIDAVSGESVADNVIHMTAYDQSDQTYNVTGFGLYLDDGTLFAVYSAAVAPIFSKAALAYALFAHDIAFENDVSANIAFGDALLTYPPATTTKRGVARLATPALAAAGVDAETIMTPALVAAMLDALLPSGAVIDWYGTVETIPGGWLLCDGTNGTPDMRGRFRLGAAVNADLGDTGGAATHIHVADAAPHALTIAQMPAHQHGNGVADDNAGNIFPYGTTAGPAGGNVNSEGGSNSIQGLTQSIGGGEAHDHAITVDAASNMPPFVALFAIMKA